MKKTNIVKKPKKRKLFTFLGIIGAKDEVAWEAIGYNTACSDWQEYYTQEVAKLKRGKNEKA